MLADVVSVKALDGYRVQLRFEDDAEGVVDISTLVKFTGIFAPLTDRDYFSKVGVDLELGTIVWPNGADIDPEVLYAAATGKPLSRPAPTLTGK